jgi:hypothetical protein
LRELLAALGGAVAARPLAASAQQQALPVVAFVTPSERDSFPPRGIRPRRFGLRCSRYRSDLCGTRLHNPANGLTAEATLRDIPEAARTLGLQVQVLKASTGPEIDAGFSAMVRDRADALFIAPDAFFVSRRVQFATLAARDRVPTSCANREMVEAGLLMSLLSERLGQQFVVENRPGAGGNMAAEAVVRSAPDGYTLLLPASPDAINVTLYQKLNFNFIRDIAPVAGIVHVPNVMVVQPSFPAKTVPEFIAYAKANPGKITMASAGVGSTSHMSGELFKMMGGVNMVHVPYRGQPSRPRFHAKGRQSAAVRCGDGVGD